MAAPQIIAEPEPVEQELVRLYRQHASALSRYAGSRAADLDAARDAVQEVFLRYFLERRGGREIGNPRAWMYQVLRNYLFDCNRNRTSCEVVLEDVDYVADSRQNPEGMLQRSEVTREIESMLSKRELECLRLRTEGRDYAEIGKAMGIRSGTVGALLARAQKKIQRAGAPR